MNTHRISCCDFHGIDTCRQGRDCPARLYTQDGGESVDNPVFTTEEAFDWTKTLLVAAFCGVCLAAAVAPFIFA